MERVNKTERSPGFGKDWEAAMERAERSRNGKLRKARAQARHTKEGWDGLLDEVGGTYGVCVRCLRVGWFLVKDHIVPLANGGSDGIDNLQPLCARCNSSKKHRESINWLGVWRGIRRERQHLIDRDAT